MHDWWRRARTTAIVDLATQDNVTWEDAWQFWPPGTWCGCGSGGPYAPVTNPGEYSGSYNWNFTGATGFTGCTGPFSNWNFNGQNFRLDIKTQFNATGPALTLTGAQGNPNGSIVVQDPINRILQMNVPEATLTAALTPGEYLYELMMYDSSNPPVRVSLMKGKFTLVHGIAGG